MRGGGWLSPMPTTFPAPLLGLVPAPAPIMAPMTPLVTAPIVGGRGGRGGGGGGAERLVLFALWLW